jgi:hypothetical protein
MEAQMKPIYIVAALMLAGSILISCGDRVQSEHAAAKAEGDIAIERGLQIAARYAEEKRLRDEEDKRIAPFDSHLTIESLSTEEKMQLCGSDYRKVAVGWPIKKALACSGRDMYLASETAGGLRIWQHCSVSSSGGCLTVGEQDGRVVTWSR